MKNDIDLGIMDTDSTRPNQEIIPVNTTEPVNPVYQNNDLALDAMFIELCIPQNLTAKEYFTLGIASLNSSVLQLVRAGAAFYAAQQEIVKNTVCDVSHTTFGEWLRSHDTPSRRAYEAISVFKAYAALPLGQRKKFLSMGVYKAVGFASLDTENIKEIAEQGPDKLDEFALMSRAEMKAEINRLKKRVSEQNTELELKSKSIAKLQNRRRTTDFTQETEDVRAECLALQAECELPINSLEKLFEEHVNSSEKEYWERMGQIWITVNVVCARAVDLSTRMKDLLGEDNLPKRIQTEHTMLPDEAERWILDYRRIVNDHENARYERQRKREEAVPRGRGRPRKIAQ